jgi:hypothetical protein
MQLMADAQIIKNIHGQTSANRMKPFYYNNNHFINMVVLFWSSWKGQARSLQGGLADGEGSVQLTYLY